MEHLSHCYCTGAKIITTRFEDTSVAAASNNSNNNTSRMSTMSAAGVHNNKRASTSGWAMFSPSVPKDTYVTRFLIDILYPENAVIKLSRTYEEISRTRDTLLAFPDKMVKDRTSKAGDFPVIIDGACSAVQYHVVFVHICEIKSCSSSSLLCM